VDRYHTGTSDLFCTVCMHNRGVEGSAIEEKWGQLVETTDCWRHAGCTFQRRIFPSPGRAEAAVLPAKAVPDLPRESTVE
jgi:hypothetical protein